MAASQYLPVAVSDHAPSSASSSHEERVLTPSTPEQDSDDEDRDLDHLEAEDVGYELDELRDGGRSSARNGDDEVDTHQLLTTPHHRRRHLSTASFELYTPTEGQRVRRKLDTHLVLFVALLYLLSFLDRSNIGNAKLAGLTRDLQLSDDQYAWLLQAFYITYICFEWMTLCYTIFPAHVYISCCVCAWGVLASLQSVVGNFAQLLVLRALLGIGEAAFVGVPIYLSYFFRREELAFRTGLFISAAPLATSFASSLAWLIIRFGENTGIDDWRLLFLIEGTPACLVAVWAWYWLPDSPSTAHWLTPRQRKIATLRMRAEPRSTAKSSPETKQTSKPKKLHWSSILSPLTTPRTYLTALIFFLCNVAFSSMPVFLPTIIASMGHTALAAQALSAPPYLTAFAVVLLTAHFSDCLASRSIPMALHALAAGTGYVLLAFAEPLHLSPGARYAALFPICAGFFSAVTLVITWTLNNQTSDQGKGTGMAVLNVVGQLGPLVGTRLYPDADGPFYARGMGVCAAAMVGVAGLALGLRAVLRWENARKRRRREGGGGEGEGEGLVGTRGRREDGFFYIT